ncbi:unnamed protein product [Mytilus coruscus]|uniref:SRCR domain-containing protein n=1 Tax=Mytilus coruscus TaxID=42192 RepID=A0A6J8CT95_MYTCO|nr:unnamed protein product [Mytilus coruscus]
MVHWISLPMVEFCTLKMELLKLSVHMNGMISMLEFYVDILGLECQEEPNICRATGHIIGLMPMASFCMGNETDAFDCYVNENDTTNGMCYQMDDAAVDCYTSSMPMTSFFNDKNGTLDITSDGRVLYTENGITETICSYEWDDIDAGVLYDKNGTLDITSDGRVLYTENGITETICSYEWDDIDAGVLYDKNGTLDITSDGRVLYTENGITETICSYEWDDIDAGVLCRHLGLGMSGGAKYLPRDWSYNRANAYGVFCMGNETDAFDCYVNENDTTNGMCYQMDDAAVDCYTSSMPMTSFFNDKNGTLDITSDGRVLYTENGITETICSYEWDDIDAGVLYDKNGTLDITSDGRVLYTENGITETICSYEWDDIDAGVLCRHLGLGMSGGAKYLPRDWSYNRANAYGVFCMGNETDAFDCYVNENDTTNGMCYQMDDAAVDCYTSSMPMTSFFNDKNGTLDITSDGRVLYTENGITETICSYEWDDIDAGVLCRHLGLGMSGGAKYLPRDWSYNRANAYGVFCMGNETDAFDCYVNENDTTNGMCYQMDDAAVDCYTSSMPMTSFFNDKNGTLDITSDGRVLYTENGITETICSYEWDDIDAGVLCRHLGLGMSGGAKYLPRDWSYNRANAYGVFCMGNETDAFDCYVNENDTTNGMCYQMDDAAVDCYTSSMPMTSFFNDKNGTLDITSDGRVLYTENGITETICSYEWDDIDAGVLCRHLGLGMSGGAKYLPRDWSYNRANAYGVFCMGNETDAFDCYVNENDTTNGMCYQMDDAAVDCYTSSMPMTSFFNDKNGTLDITSDGRVLYTENGITETICSYEWDDIDAGVLCRHLGLGMSGGAKYLPRDWSYNRANAYGVFFAWVTKRMPSIVMSTRTTQQMECAIRWMMQQLIATLVQCR